MIKLFWWGENNFGDAISPFIVEHFWGKVERVSSEYKGKLLAVGSIIPHARDNDTIWGSGLARDIKIKRNLKVLATRGPLTAERIGTSCSVYGDPGLLLPLIYNPEVQVKHKIGTIPHYIEKGKIGGDFLIDIEADWKKVVRDIKSCELIASSSLHGIVAAESYGIPAIWLPPGPDIIGGEHKFHDYILGTDRKEQKPGILPPIKNLKEIQERLIYVTHKDI